MIPPEATTLAMNTKPTLRCNASAKPTKCWITSAPYWSDGWCIDIMDYESGLAKSFMIADLRPAGDK